MKVSVVKTDEIDNLDVEVLAAGVFEGENFALSKQIKKLDDLTDGALMRALSKNKKFGKPFENLAFFISPKKHKFIEELIMVGLGKPVELDNYKLKQVAAAASKLLRKEATNVGLYLPIAQADQAAIVVNGFVLGTFDSGHQKTGDEDKKSRIMSLVVLFSGDLAKAGDAAQQGLLFGQATNKIRKLVNLPANICTPQYMAKFAQKIAQDNHLKIEVFSEKQVNEMGMGIMASVAKGSEEDLYFVVMRYQGAGPKGKTLALVGKGITFDTGGLSIKPSEGMDWMKMDMAGAAAVLGAMDVIAKLKPKINVVAVAPLTENLPSGRASKPGDVARGLSGKTVEIINTDAEGRLVLSDALTYVQKNFKPEWIVDVATLVGATITALGNWTSGIFGRPQKFVDEVVKVAADSGERLWQLPLYDEYKEQLKSYIADIANVSPGRAGGPETGAKFLEEFVDKGVTWVHLDICPTAWEENEKPYAAKGATGVAVATLVNLALNLARGR